MCYIEINFRDRAINIVRMHTLLTGLCTFGLLVLLWSAINPHDYFTWFLEVFPAIIALPILFFSYKKFPLTPLLYVLILIHAIVLMVGGHYTYAEVPLFNWLRDTFDLSRNYYDRVGHFAQGFVPAMIAREILLRKNVMKSGAWLFFIVCSICLAISACYEFVEWWVAVSSGTAAEAFLGTQGDVWDTQWDMFLALVGAICAQLFLKDLHDKQLVNLKSGLET
jgi:putative membrane protein